jgi:hypothetical protein
MPHRSITSAMHQLLLFGSLILLSLSGVYGQGDGLEVDELVIPEMNSQDWDWDDEGPRSVPPGASISITFPPDGYRCVAVIDDLRASEEKGEGERRREMDGTRGRMMNRAPPSTTPCLFSLLLCILSCSMMP